MEVKLVLELLGRRRVTDTGLLVLVVLSLLSWKRERQAPHFHLASMIVFIVPWHFLHIYIKNVFHCHSKVISSKVTVKS